MSQPAFSNIIRSSSSSLVEVAFGHVPQEDEKHNVLSPKIYMKSIDLQLVSSLLTAVNWRNIFADDRHVDDYVTSFMHVFNNAIQQSIFKGPVRNSKPNRILPKRIRQLIRKNIVFGKRFTIKTALPTTGLCVEKPNRRSAIMFLVGNKNIT